jgi:4-amino-4-deoxy-L-arabinose transferase-like glycosyltransferase
MRAPDLKSLGPHLRTWWRTDAGIGWLVTLAITALAFGLRLSSVGLPHEFSFDETYYAKDAWSLWHNGYAANWCSPNGTACSPAAIADAHLLSTETADANRLMLHGVDPCRLIVREAAPTTPAPHVSDTCVGGEAADPEMSVHPEVGKWLIGAGEQVFGMNPLGWRFPSVLIGSLMVGVFIRFVRRLTRSNVLAGLAGLLLTFDGLEFVLSRLALLDIYVAFFTLLAVHLMVKDRDWLRARLERPEDEDRDEDRDQRSWILWRPWLFTSGIAWGLGLGSKWDVAYPMAAFCLLYVAWCVGARRRSGNPAPARTALVRDGVAGFMLIVPIALIVYIASWAGWLTHAHVYEESVMSHSQYTQYTSGGSCKNGQFVDYKSNPQATWPTMNQHHTGLAGMVQSLHSLWDYHQDVYTFHTVFLQCTTHPYASQPEGWPLLNRPVGISAENDIKPGTTSNHEVNPSGEVCQAPDGSTCLRQVLALGTPVLWWGCAIGALCAIGLWVGARDWRAGIVVVGAASTWLPWLMYADRTIFSYYAISMLPFTILGVVLCLGRLMSGSANRRTAAAILGGTFVVLVILNFAWFWPIYTDGLLTRETPVTLGNFWRNWLSRMWFLKWI